MRTKVLVLLAAFAILGMIGPSTAKADQITLTDACTGVLFASAPSSVSGTVSGCTADFVSGGITTNGFTWSLTNGTDFLISGNSQSLTGTVNWTLVSVLSSVTVLEGFLNVGTVGNSGNDFNGQFVSGQNYLIDLTLVGTNCSAGEYQEGCRVSSGEVLVPEPGSLMLFGTGLLSMAGFLRRKLFA